MPVPSLPLDLVFEIVSHLEEEEKIAEQIQGGKTVSLVCRAWRSLGQALRWRRVKIERLQLSSLLDHFAQFPHLANLVRDFRLDGSLSQDLGSLDSSLEEALPQIPRFLSILVNLARFVISGDMEEDLVPILKAASHLDNLRFLRLRAWGDFDCSNEFVASFRSGFKSLSTLFFTAYNPTQSSFQLDNTIASSHKIPIKSLGIRWKIRPAEPSTLSNDFLSIVDPATLRSVHLFGHAACPDLLKCLSGHSNLVNLNLQLDSQENVGDLKQILPILTRFSALKGITLQLTDLDKEDGFESPVSLFEIIACIPPSLRGFSARQFIFPDFYQIPVRQVKLSHESRNVKCILVRCPLDMLGSTYTFVWGEEIEGKLQWFREPQEANAAEAE
ncbi:hypothetical protein JCM3765_000570 [Sporobolomyces pararoseus]